MSLDVIDCGIPDSPSNGYVTLTNGDTQYGAIATYTCSCNSGYTLTGTTDRQCQSNGQWNASNPTCDPVAIDCGNLGVPDNGQAHCDIYNYTSIVTFSCNKGYNLSNDSEIECLSNGQWSASNPTCDPVDCGDPGVPDNGQAHGDIYNYTSIVAFSCNKGYNLSNDSEIECLSNGQWSASNPTCDPVDCGDPGVPDNGQAHGDIYNYASIVTFSCNKGYNLSNDSEIECLSNGQWSASNPTCDPVDCGDPGVPDNGQAHGDIYNYASIVTFSCNKGYNLSNDSEIECLSNGQWSASNPTCDPVDCGDPGVPDNGQAHGDIYNYTSIVAFSCNKGYNLSNDSEIECLSNGQWSASSPTCDPVDCGNPGVPDNGQAHGDIYNYTSIVAFSCNKGYNLSNDSEIECLSNGQWSASSPTCDPVDCGNPGVPDNGQAHGDIYNYTSIVAFSCNKGYNLSNDSEIECLSNGQWSASNPTCDPVDCGNPGVPDNGQAHGGIYNYASIVTFSCNKGYNLSNDSEIECLSNGQWSASNPTCDPVDCGDPGVPDNGQAHGDIYNYTSIVAFSCNKGYNLSNDSEIECLSNGQWNASIPICILFATVNCSNPGVPDNGQAHGEIFNYTSIVIFSCDIGYILSDNYGIECQSNGLWNTSNPTCDPVDCGNPGVPDNGQVHGDIYTYNSVINYTCNEGYLINGSHSIVCLPYGNWSSSAPLCSRG